MSRLLVLMRRMQSRKIMFAGLVCGSCTLRGRGTGNKPRHRDGQRHDANKTKARHNSSAAPRIAAVLRTPMTRNRVKLARSRA
jgi:hypothetical protein